MSKKSILLSALWGDGHPFDNVFDTTLPVKLPEHMDTIRKENPDDKLALVIWGGGDISPTLYGELPSEACGAEVELSDRDKLEVALARKAFEMDIPIIGVCRGAQMVCALAGGKLVQHVTRHAGGYHDLFTSDGKLMRCPSLHHQMMYPWGLPEDEWTMLAWTPKPLSDVYYGGVENGKQVHRTLPGHEPEVIWMPKKKGLLIQSHPEFISDLNHPFVVYTLSLTRKYVLCQD